MGAPVRKGRDGWQSNADAKKKLELGEGEVRVKVRSSRILLPGPMKLKTVYPGGRGKQQGGPLAKGLVVSC